MGRRRADEAEKEEKIEAEEVEKRKEGKKVDLLTLALIEKIHSMGTEVTQVGFSSVEHVN